MKEIWKDVDLSNYRGEDYTGLYQVSNLGRVKGLSRLKYSKGKVYSAIKEKILKPSFARDYLIIMLSKNNKRKGYLLSRLVAVHFVPNPDNKPEVNHKDGIKRHNFDYNLEWSTRSENMKHAVKNDLLFMHHGEDLTQSKLKECHVLFIRKLLKKGRTHKYIAKMFYVDKSTISDIKRRKTWAWLV
jgi:hypothetical protein